MTWYAYIRYRDSDPDRFLDGDQLYPIADELGLAKERLARAVKDNNAADSPPGPM